jgi:hypothetical protein
MITKSATAAMLAILFTSPAYPADIKGLGESAGEAAGQAQEKTQGLTSRAQSILERSSGQWKVAGDTANLVEELSSQLGVSSEQAAGGTAALFSMAQSQLSGEQFGGITDKVSGLSGLLGSGESGGGMAASLLKNVNSLEGAQNAFSALGMSPDMVGRFAPVVLQFLGGQGVGAGALDTLKKLWTPAA